jgi:hypothetical protein
MKKYFLHNGTTHEGPFDFEELKPKEITSNTPVWYDGLDDWTTAGNVEELRVLIKPTLPTKRPLITMVFVIIGILVIAAVIVIIVKRPKPVSQVKVKPNTPIPIVVIQSADFSKEGLLKLKATIYTTILNQGAAGNILVNFHVRQNGRNFDKSKAIYLKANESQKLEMTFDQVKILEGDVEYKVESIVEKK